MPSLQGLTRLSEDELARFDVAELNLACAIELPGSERMDMAACLVMIDRYVRWTFSYTEAAYIEEFLPHPGKFEHSEPYFRLMALTTVLQRGVGIRYDPAHILDPDFTDSRSQFLHGVFEGRGTCVSLPVLFIAVGRRLGYPMRLVQTHGHLFARWDDPRTGERLNVECTSWGFVSHPDDYYEGWPFRLSLAERRSECFLRSMTPRQG